MSEARVSALGAEISVTQSHLGALCADLEREKIQVELIALFFEKYKVQTTARDIFVEKRLVRLTRDREAREDAVKQYEVLLGVPFDPKLDEDTQFDDAEKFVKREIDHVEQRKASLPQRSGFFDASIRDHRAKLEVFESQRVTLREKRLEIWAVTNAEDVKNKSRLATAEEKVRKAMEDIKEHTADYLFDCLVKIKRIDLLVTILQRSLLSESQVDCVVQTLVKGIALDVHSNETWYWGGWARFIVFSGKEKDHWTIEELNFLGKVVLCGDYYGLSQDDVERAIQYLGENPWNYGMLEDVSVATHLDRFALHALLNLCIHGTEEFMRLVVMRSVAYACAAGHYDLIRRFQKAFSLITLNFPPEFFNHARDSLVEFKVEPKELPYACWFMSKSPKKEVPAVIREMFKVLRNPLLAPGDDVRQACERYYKTHGFSLVRMRNGLVLVSVKSPRKGSKSALAVLPIETLRLVYQFL